MARCKYQKLQYQVSYDEGSTWQDVTPLEVKKGNLIESPSSDCSVIQTLYRWVDLEGTYVCDGNNKYTRRIQEESYDDGVTWYASYPTVYDVGTFVGVDEEYCCDKFVGHYHYEPPAPTPPVYHSCPNGYRWNGYECRERYTDPLKVVRCNSNPTLTSGETSYYEESGRLLFCEIGDTVESIGDAAFSGQTLLSAMTLPNSITSIGTSAFTNCISLSSMTIPSGVTSIGNNAFLNCSGLTSIDIPNGVTTIGWSTFKKCTSLTSVTIGSGVTTIGANAFSECSGLTNITLPSSVTTIGTSSFSGCTSLTSMTIPSGVTSINNNAFYRCSGLTSINVEPEIPPTIGSNTFAYTNGCPIIIPCNSLPLYRTTGEWVNLIGRMETVSSCNHPTPTRDTKIYATYSNGDIYYRYCDESSALTTSYTKPNYYHYSAMTSAEIGSCISSISTSAFSECNSLTSVTIPSSVTSIGESAFRSCRNLTNITIPNSVTSIGDYAFRYCTSITSFEIPNSITSIGNYSFLNCSGLTSVSIGSGLTTINKGAFENCTTLTSMTIPSNITTIGDSAFTNCSSLEMITVEATTPPALVATSAHSGGGIIVISYSQFDNTNNSPIYVPCESLLTYRNADGWKGYKTRIFGIPPCEDNVKFHALYSDNTSYSAECASYADTLSTGVTRAHSTSYTAMTMAEVGECVKTINTDAFRNCISLTSVTMTDNVTNIGQSAFNNCSGLTNIEISDGVTTIGSYAFSSCTSLESVTVPSGVTSMGEYAFSKCAAITSLTIESGCTKIGENAFRYCSGLTTVIIPDTVTSIGLYAFKDCTSLTSITLNGKKPLALSTGAFDNTNNCPIYVPCGWDALYKIAYEGWLSYQGRIQVATPCVEPLDYTHYVSTSYIAYLLSRNSYIACDYNFDVLTQTVNDTANIVINAYDQESIYFEIYSTGTVTADIYVDDVHKKQMKLYAGSSTVRNSATVSIGSGYHKVEFIWTGVRGYIGINGF